MTSPQNPTHTQRFDVTASGHGYVTYFVDTTVTGEPGYRETTHRVVLADGTVIDELTRSYRKTTGRTPGWYSLDERHGTSFWGARHRDAAKVWLALTHEFIAAGRFIRDSELGGAR